MNDIDLSARLHDLDRHLTSPGDVLSPESAIALYRRRRRTRAGLIATAAAVLAIAVGVPTAIGSLSSSGEVAAPSTSMQPSSTPPSAPTTPTPRATTTTPDTTPTVDADPAALADLHAVAATLTTPLTLTSPTVWDQWLPQGKPYPGVDTADDLSTCPKLADRLGAALGRKMSYWVGTLPGGPFGCQWATVPLYAGPNAPNYPYLASVGFVSDGTTSEQLGGGFYHHQGRLCPDVAVPSVGRGVYLARCDEPDGLSYALVLPDTRTSGIWVLYGEARPDAAHPAIDVFRTVVDGAVSTYG